MPRPASIKGTEVKDSLGHVIRVGDYLDHGRDGIVHKGQYTKGPQFDVAIKFYVPIQQNSLFSRPSNILPDLAKDLESKKDNELKILKNMNHANLQKYLSSGTMIYDKKYFKKFTSDIKTGESIPFIVSHYIKGSRLDKLIESEFCSRSNFISYILGLAKAMQCLHLNDVLHGDIRTSNVLIDEETDRSMLIDFGVSKYFSHDLKGTTKCFLDPNLVPDTIKEHLCRIEKKVGNFERQELRNIVFPILDLYQFGLMIKDILASIHDSLLTEFDRKYFYYLSIDLMECDIKSEDQQKIRIKLGGFIKNADDLVNKLERLNIGPDYYNRQFLKQERLPKKVINRPNELVEIRDSLSPILDHPTLRRLQYINQLSLIYYVYSTARQSRFDHSLSTLARCQELWKSLSNDPTFLYHINSEDINKMEIIALIHDINHFPFLHYFQEAGIKEVKKAEVLNTFLKNKFKNASTGKKPHWKIY